MIELTFCIVLYCNFKKLIATFLPEAILPTSLPDQQRDIL